MTLHALNVGDDNTVAEVIIKDGTFIGPEGTNADSGSAVTVKAGSKVTIEGGKFSGGKNNTLSAKGKMIVTGGTFDQNPEAWVAEGYKVLTSDGNFVVVSDEIDAVVSSQEEFAAAIKDNATIVLSEGTFTIPSAAGKKVTFIGSGSRENTVISIVHAGGDGANGNLSTSDVVFENLSITTDGNNFTGYARCKATYKNCVINNTYFLYGESYFYNCEFNDTGDSYNIWTYGSPKAVFEDCVFNCEGKSIYMDGNRPIGTDLTITRCTFNDLGDNTVVDGKAAIETGKTYGERYSIVVNDTDVNGFAINPNGYNTGTTLWANKHSMPADQLSVTVDGKDAYTIVLSGTDDISSAITAGASVIGLPAGTYDLPITGSNTLTFTGTGNPEDVVVNVLPAASQNTYGTTLVFEGVTIQGSTENYKGFYHTNGCTFRNCIIKDKLSLFSNSTFENCSFETTTEHCVWTYSAAEVSFKGCDFKYYDRCVNVYLDNGKGSVNVLFDDCEFNATNTDSKGAVEINSSAFPQGADVDFINCKAPEYGKMVFISGWDSTNGATATVTINGTTATVPQLPKN